MREEATKGFFQGIGYALAATILAVIVIGIREVFTRVEVIHQAIGTPLSIWSVAIAVTAVLATTCLFWWVNSGETATDEQTTE